MYIKKHISPSCETNGEKAGLDIFTAFACSVDQQIEVIVQQNNVPRIYKQYLDKHSEGGLQHLANIEKSWLKLGRTGLFSNAMVKYTHKKKKKKPKEP